MLHITDTVQLRNPTEGRACYDSKIAAGKTPMGAMRCLKRRPSNVVYRQMLHDQHNNQSDQDEPGRALGDDTSIQRDRPDPGHRLFGQATSRTRHITG